MAELWLFGRDFMTTSREEKKPVPLAADTQSVFSFEENAGRSGWDVRPMHCCLLLEVTRAILVQRIGAGSSR